jgi:hypothetical protein
MPALNIYDEKHAMTRMEVETCIMHHFLTRGNHKNRLSIVALGKRGEEAQDPNDPRTDLEAQHHCAGQLSFAEEASKGIG